MPLSPSAQNELRAELDYIASLRQRLDARAEVIRAVLEPFDMGQAGLPFALPGAKVTADTNAVLRTLGVPRTVKNKFASTGLRAAVLDILRARGPLRAPDVARVLADGGFENDSKTALPIRVYNDLWRMKEAGIVENKGGMFSLKEVA